MTSQIFMLNQSGVAIASDTMVSWDAHRGGTKTLPDKSKIFDLGSSHKMVVALSGSAGLAGVDFFTLLREWSMQLVGPLETLDAYVADFAEWFPQGIALFKISEEVALNSYFCRSLSLLDDATSGRLSAICRRVSADTSASEKKAAEKEAGEILSSFNFGDTHFEDVTAESLDKFDRLLINDSSIVTHFTNDMGIRWEISKSFAEKIVSLSHDFFTHPLPGVYDRTSLNFIGFGRNEPIAGVVSVGIGGYFNNLLRFQASERTPEAHSTEANWQFAAQQSAMQSFLEGVNYNELHWILNLVSQLLHDELHLDNEKVNGHIDQLMDQILGRLDGRYIQPALRIVEAAALPGLIRFADALVHAQSLRSVTDQDEATVGGIIEVVSISRTEGVHWHRKLGGALNSGSPHVLV
jgi:hypothetical protein